MTVSLAKGQNVNLTKDNPSSTKYKLGLAWDAAAAGGQTVDLDVAAFQVDASGKAPNGLSSIIYYGNLGQQPPGQAIVHSGDQRDGTAAGDDETLEIDLSKLDASVEKIIILLSIYEADKKKQNFGQVQNAKAKLYDEAGKVLYEYDLTEDYSIETSVVMVEFYKHGGDWKYKAIGQGLKPVTGFQDNSAMAEFFRQVGVAVA